MRWSLAASSKKLRTGRRHTSGATERDVWAGLVQVLPFESRFDD